jgi:hypothetical protein
MALRSRIVIFYSLYTGKTGRSCVTEHAILQKEAADNADVIRRIADNSTNKV